MTTLKDLHEKEFFVYYSTDMDWESIMDMTVEELQKKYEQVRSTVTFNPSGGVFATDEVMHRIFGYNNGISD